jgi:hypothetical protein
VWYQIQIKKQIRIAAEEEELESYEPVCRAMAGRLETIGTDWHKPF